MAALLYAATNQIQVFLRTCRRTELRLGSKVGRLNRHPEVKEFRLAWFGRKETVDPEKIQRGIALVPQLEPELYRYF